MRLKNKVIIVTGSTTGIGKAIALRCVAEGARVVLNGLEACRQVKLYRKRLAKTTPFCI